MKNQSKKYPITGIFEDTYDDGAINISRIHIGKTDISNGTEISLKPDQELTITINATIPAGLSPKKYQNKARYYNEGFFDKTSSDWFRIGDALPEPDINKYITNITDETVEDRSGYDEAKKESEPVGAGNGTTDKIIDYKVVLKNDYDNPMTGYFVDIPHPEIQKLKMTVESEGGREIVDDEQLTIQPHSQIIINVQGKIFEGASAGKYENTAEFYNDDFDVISADWIQIGELNSEPKINKYITEITGMPKEDRSKYTEAKKEEEPADAGMNNVDKTVKYHVEVVNYRSEEIKGIFKDIPQEGIEDLKIKAKLKNIDDEAHNFENNSEMTIPAQSTAIFTITGTIKSGLEPGIYENKAIYEIEEEEIELISSDYFELASKVDIGINKYITKIDGNNQGRSEYDEKTKKDNPADAGKNNEEHSINYYIKVENKGDKKVTGIFKDQPDDRIIINSATITKRKKNGDKISTTELGSSDIPGPESVSINSAFINKMYWIGDSWVDDLFNYSIASGNHSSSRDADAEYFLGNYPSIPSDSSAIVISLGINNPYTRSTLAELIRKIRMENPNKPIFVSEVAHRGFLNEDVPDVNDAIDRYNEKIETYCDELSNVYFLDGVTSILVDSESGLLLDDFSSDGININSDGLHEWYGNIVNKIMNTEIYDYSGYDNDFSQEITLKAGQYIEVVIKATIAEGITEGTYKNTAKFECNDVTNVLESSDYFKIIEELPTPPDDEPPPDKPTPEGTLKKYVSEVSSPGQFKDGRKDMDSDTKYKYPAEVENGGTVTFTVETTVKNVWYQNTTYGCSAGGVEPCETHPEIHELDWVRVKDDFDSQFLSYSSITGDYGVEFDGEYIQWNKIPIPDTEDHEIQLTANITFTVIASNMKKMNIENNVHNVEYQYTKYCCTPDHNTYHPGYALADGSWSSGWNDHTGCYMDHSTTVDSKDLGGQDSDYVRLLDPIIGGVVFLDKNANDLKDGSDEDLGQMAREQYKKVTVELYCIEKDNERVDTTEVDPETGEFTFGRVLKGPNKEITEPPGYKGSNEYTNIGEGNYFYYSSETLYHYYLVFNYDGERFTAVKNAEYENLDPSDHSMNEDFPNDSNADELGRTEFNKRLETIANNKAYAGPNSSSTRYGVSYETEGTRLQNSYALWDGVTTSVLNITAQSVDLFFDDGGDTDYLQHINLGLIERERPDISLTKDVVSAEVTINGFKTTYNYNSLGEGEYTIDTNNTIAKPYTLRIYREDYEFRTENNYDPEIVEILKQNNKFKQIDGVTEKERSNDLEIILTYKITVENKAPTSNAVIKEVVDCYSNEVTLLEETVKLDGQRLTVKNESSFENSEAVPGNGIVKYFTGEALNNKSLKPGESLEIYSQYIVNKDGNGYIMIDKESDQLEQTKYNVAEVGAYSFYESENTPSGLIDVNSNPANNELDGDKYNTDKFEDDTFETGVKILLRDFPEDPPPPGDPPGNPPGDPPGGDPPPDNPPPDHNEDAYRHISGVVFEELDKEATEKSDRQLVGDGKMDGEKDAADGYKLAKNVIVKLYEVVQKKSELDEVEEEFLIDTGMWSRTDENGEYSFGDKVNETLNGTAGENSVDDRYRLHAGLYVVRFVYGDEADKLVTVDGNTIRYSGQDYQSVKYSDPGDVNKEDEIIEASKFTDLTGLTTEENSKLVGFDKNHSEGEKVVSVAKDNEIRRLEVNEYSTTMTYLMDTVLKAKENTDETKLLAEHTSMFADTKEFNMQIEYYGNYDNKESKEIDGTVTDYYYYSVRDVNFGLIERPKTKLQLMNDIKEIKAVTSDDETILDLVFDITYSKSGDKETMNHESTLNVEKSKGSGQAQVLNRDEINQGFRYVNVDTDILQGMKITVIFQVAVGNISEVDHLTNWLETNIEGGKDTTTQVQSGANVDLKVDFEASGENPSVIKAGNKVTDLINTKYLEEEKLTGREYDYTNSYLHGLLNTGGQVGSGENIAIGLKSVDNGKIYNYGNQSSSNINGIGSDNIKKAYSYNNIVKKVQPTYKTGYYLGNLYYTNEIGGDQAQVRTRVDQYIDYVDNDLIFKPEENISENGKIKYLTYTTKEIAERGLLRDITPETKEITDGEKEYYSSEKENVNNNLAFNIEDPDVNKEFYRYLPRIPEGDKQQEKDLYVITLEASRTLTSEIDLDGVVIDNLAEIIKVANTAGRKVYVRDDEMSEGEEITGNIGNTTKPPIEVNDPERPDDNPKEYPKTLVEVARYETDTDFTEYITFSPPTGLNPIEAEAKIKSDKATDMILLIIPTVIVIAGVSYVTIEFVRKKKFYK